MPLPRSPYHQEPVVTPREVHPTPEQTPTLAATPVYPATPSFAIDLHDNEDDEELLDWDDEVEDDLAPAFSSKNSSESREYVKEYEETDDGDNVPDLATDSRARGLSDSVLASVELLLAAIASDDSSEVLMNGPNEIMFKRSGARYHIPDIRFEDAETYHRVINEFILPYTDTAERINDQSYLIEGQMEYSEDENEAPMLARVHIIAPPVVKHALVTIAKKARRSFTVDDLAANGSMSQPMAEFLKAIARGRVTTVLAGLSGAGKTTLLEAMTHYFDQDDRVIVVEDTPELRLPISDTVYMASTSSKPGIKREDVVTIEWLVRATNRMRPDRIIVGEVRGAEMSEFLIAANSGADGSMTTLHASNPRMTLEKMLSLAMKSEGAKSEITIRREIASTVQIVVQASLIEGRHVVTHIEEISNTIREQTGAIATQTLFEYNRDTGRHEAKSRPSENLQAYMAQRGVQIDPAWFTR